MQQEHTQVWRSLLQLAQATYAVLEREIPECEGLPTNGLAVLRLLRWHGEKTLPAIAAFVGVPAASMDETIGEMVRSGFIRRPPESSGATPDVFELAPQGVVVAKRIITSQRDRIEQAIARLPDDDHEAAATFLEALAYELAADSAGFGITCAECWALDVRECIKPASDEQCAFRRAQRADLDPDLGEGPDECPGRTLACAAQYVDPDTDPGGRA